MADDRTDGKDGGVVWATGSPEGFRLRPASAQISFGRAWTCKGGAGRGEQQQIKTVFFHLLQAREPPTVPARTFGVSKAPGRTGFCNPTPSRGERGHPGESRPTLRRPRPDLAPPHPDSSPPGLLSSAPWGSRSRPRHGSPEAARPASQKSPRVGSAAGPPGPPLPQDYLAAQPALCPPPRHRRAAAAARSAAAAS